MFWLVFNFWIRDNFNCMLETKQIKKKFDHFEINNDNLVNYDE